MSAEVYKVHRVNVQGTAEVDGHYPAHQAAHAKQQSNPIDPFDTVHDWSALRS